MPPPLSRKLYDCLMMTELTQLMPGSSQRQIRRVKVKFREFTKLFTTFYKKLIYLLYANI